MSAAAVPFLDLQVSQRPLQGALDAAWQRVTRSSRYIGGDSVSDFEREWAAQCGNAHAVGVANGTDAIELALRALGVGPGDEVLVPANTFIGTAGAVVAAGATPHFVDVDPDTLLVTAGTAAAALGSRTVALVVVHLYGQPADMTALVRMAEAAGIALVEDCAQAHGARWQGRPVGSFGAAGCFSFYPGKNLGALGDAGAVVTSDADLAGRVRQLGDHGRAPASKHQHDAVGRNSRLDALQAEVLSVKLGHLEEWNSSRRRAHDRYASRLQGVPGVELVLQRPGSRSSHHLEVVQVPERNAVRAALAGAGIETGVHYPVACPDAPAYRGFPCADVPVARTAARHLLSLPMFPGISTEQVDTVCDALLSSVRPPVPPMAGAPSRTSSMHEVVTR